VLAFNGFYVDPRQRLLFNENGENLPLPSRAFDTLLFMAQHSNELLDKQRLMKAVWPQTTVEENNLSQHISLLRKVLGEAPNQHRFIVTVPGRGFRFVPQVRVLDELPWAAPGKPAGQSLQQPVVDEVVLADEPRRHSRWYLGSVLAAATALLAIVGLEYLWEREPAAIVAPSIAILAFADMSPGQDQGYFSDGLTEELYNKLMLVPKLTVIGGASSSAFKGRNEDSRRIGELLGVNHILAGSVRKSGDRIRISAKLIIAANGKTLWGDTYERKLGEIFAIQDEIAHKVVARLQLKLDVQDLNAGGTKNAAAYEEFLAGRAMLASNVVSDLITAASDFEQAVMLDPEFMTARLWLIDAYLRTSLGSVEMKDSAIAKQEAVIDEVAKRAPGRPEASLALSYRAARGRDLVELERLLKDAMRVQGSPGTRARLRFGQFLLGSGSSAAALREFKFVQRNDPLDDFVRTHVFTALEQAGLLDKAEMELQQLMKSPGGNVTLVHGAAVRMALGQGDKARLGLAVQAAIDSGSISGEEADRLQQLLNNPDLALRNLRRLAEESDLQGDVFFASSIAQNAAYLGDRQLALESLKALFNSKFAFETVAFVLWVPGMKEVRGEPAFKALVRDLGLETYWRTTGNWGDFCAPVGADDFECH
jgi:TolB-like protein/DNA-binding winged helix-turn-helix (wHTH) protein